MIPFAQFAPDRSDFDANATDTATNVVPRPNGYGPFNGFSVVSSALAAVPRGAILTRTTAGAYRIFVGTETALYEFDSVTKGWTDVSKAATTYGVPAESAWSFAQFGDLVIAANGFDENQSFDLGGSTGFADLGGTPPKAKYMAVVGDFLALGNTDDYEVNGIAWSGYNDATYWTPYRKGSDFQIFPDGGEVQGIAPVQGGAVVFQDNAIRMMTPTFDKLVFTFQKTDDTKTLIAPRGVVQAGGAVYYVTLQGFYRFPNEPIGNERVDRFFAEDVDFDYLWQTQGAADPINNLVYWRYRSVNHASTETTDKVLIYNYAIDRWSIAEVELSWIMSATTPAETLESLDTISASLDALGVSLDSRTFAGGTPLIAGFDASYRLGFFSGSPLEAVVQTGDVQLIPPRRAFVQGFSPVCDADSVAGRVATKDRHGDDRVWNAEYDVQRTGLVPARASGRLHRFEVTVPAGEAWSHLHGVVPEAVPEGSQ